MAKATGEDPQNPKAEGEEGVAAKPEFLVGKFNTVEDQAKAYAALEKKYHEDLNAVKSEVRSLKEQTKKVEAPLETHQDQGSQELVDFYGDPVGYKRRIKEEVKMEMRQEQQQTNAVAQVISHFFSENTDLKGQEPLLEWYVRQEPQDATPQERLIAAAKRTREHISNLRKSPEPKPNPAEFVDEPSGSQPKSGSSHKATPEQERKEYFKERTDTRKVKSKLPQGE